MYVCLFGIINTIMNIGKYFDLQFPSRPQENGTINMRTEKICRGSNDSAQIHSQSKQFVDFKQDIE